MKSSLVVLPLRNGRLTYVRGLFQDVQVGEVFEIEHSAGTPIRKIAWERTEKDDLGRNAELVYSPERKLYIHQKAQVWRHEPPIMTEEA